MHDLLCYITLKAFFFFFFHGLLVPYFGSGFLVSDFFCSGALPRYTRRLKVDNPVWRFSLFSQFLQSVSFIPSFCKETQIRATATAYGKPAKAVVAQKGKAATGVPIAGIKTSDPTSFFFSRKRATSDAAHSICYSAWSRPSA